MCRLLLRPLEMNDAMPQVTHAILPAAMPSNTVFLSSLPLVPVSFDTLDFQCRVSRCSNSHLSPGAVQDLPSYFVLLLSKGNTILCQAPPRSVFRIAEAQSALKCRERPGTCISTTRLHSFRRNSSFFLFFYPSVSSPRSLLVSLTHSVHIQVVSDTRRLRGALSKAVVL